MIVDANVCLCKHDLGGDLDSGAQPKRAAPRRHWYPISRKRKRNCILDYLTGACLLTNCTSLTYCTRALTRLPDFRSNVKAVVSLKEPKSLPPRGTRLRESDLAPPFFASRVTHPLRPLITPNVSCDQPQSLLPTPRSPLSTIHSLDTFIITLFGSCRYGGRGNVATKRRRREG